MKKYSIASNTFNIGDLSETYIEFAENVPTHMHEGIELVYVVNGRGDNIINDDVIPSKRGTFIMMSSKCTHEIKMMDTLQYYSIMFLPSFFDESVGIDKSFFRFVSDVFGYDLQEQYIVCNVSDEDECKYIEALFFKMLCEIVEQKSRYRMLVRDIVDIIITYMLRSHIPYNANEKNEKMDLAIRYICSHCMEDLKLEDVADMFHYNPDYFSKKLKSYYGIGFKQILIHQKLTNVVHELLSTNDSVDTIIGRNGFINKTYFYEVFTKTYGVKPRFIREYRGNFRKFLEIKVNHRNSF